MDDEFMDDEFMDDGFLRGWGQSVMRMEWPKEPSWVQAARLDAARERIEAGPGGDVDADGRLTRTGRSYVPGLKRTVSTWLRLYERVQRGELGGAGDGLRPTLKAAGTAATNGLNQPAGFVVARLTRTATPLR